MLPYSEEELIIANLDRRHCAMYDEASIMTDFQFKAIIQMVLDLMESNQDPERVKEMLKKLLGKDKEE